MDPMVIQLFANLAEVAARNSAGAIATRVAALKARKQSAETANELTEIIDELVADRDAALGIARGLKDELVSQQISDDDIEHIVETVLPAIRSVLAAAPPSGNGEEGEERLDVESLIEMLKPILTHDTLKVLQTLGFNFRAAIGEPLTLLLRNLILANARSPIVSEDLELARLQRETEFYRLVQDPVAYERLTQS